MDRNFIVVREFPGHLRLHVSCRDHFAAILLLVLVALTLREILIPMDSGL